MEISAQFSFEKVDHTKDNTPHLVVSLKAPTLDWVTKRPNICLVPVIDLSGSMRGAKLEYAKKSLLKLVDQLVPGDITGLIGFEARVHTLVQPGPVTPELKAKLKDAINKLQPLGGTDLCSGALKALELVKSLDLGPQFLKRIILFTDGQPTSGLTDQKEILRLLSEQRDTITVSAFGYGNETNDQWSGCDHTFLGRFSQEGKGNYAYVKDPDDSLTAFGRELGGLLSTYGNDIVVEISPTGGQKVAKVVTDIAIEQNALGETEFKLPDILSEEVRHFVFETEIPKQDKHGPRPVTAFNVSVSYVVLTSDGKREVRTAEAKARIQFVEPGEEQKEPTKELDGLVGQAQLVRAQIEAEENAKKGNYTAASAIMDGLAASLEGRGFGNTTGRVARRVRSLVSDQGMYASSEGYLRSMMYGGTRGMGLSSMDAEAARDLLSCNVTLSNSSQQHTTSAFVIDPGQQQADQQPFINQTVNQPIVQPTVWPVPSQSDASKVVKPE